MTRTNHGYLYSGESLPATIGETSVLRYEELRPLANKPSASAERMCWGREAIGTIARLVE